jgi:hypothetical protein
MSPSARYTSVQLNEIIENKMKTDQGGREVQKQEDAKVDLDPENISSVLNTVLTNINHEFQNVCLEEALRLLNAHLIRQSIDSHVPGHKSSIPGRPRTKFLAHQFWAIWFIARR